MKPLFELGQVVATPGALNALATNGRSVSGNLKRHAKGDWGDLDKHDKDVNDTAVLNGLRILSAYLIGVKDKIWIITEADRSSTTILLPSEYCYSPNQSKPL